MLGSSILLCTLAFVPAEESRWLAVDNLVIAEIRQGVWKAAEQKARKFSTPVAFQEISLGKLVRQITVPGFNYYNEGPGGPYLDLELSGRPKVSAAFVSGAAPNFPRPVDLLSNQSEEYIKALQNFLNANSKKKLKARLTKVCRVDLDGDGSAEVLLEGSSRDGLGGKFSADSKPTDYSVILLRFIDRSGKVITRPLWNAISKPYGLVEEAKLVTIADFDGSGTMQIVIGTYYYEGQGGLVYSFKRGQLKKLVENFAGA